jgi:hypothetical protein
MLFWQALLRTFQVKIYPLSRGVPPMPAVAEYFGGKTRKDKRINMNIFEYEYGAQAPKLTPRVRF